MIYKCTNRVSGSDLSQALALWPLRGQMDNLRNDASCAEPKETTNIACQKFVPCCLFVIKRGIQLRPKTLLNKSLIHNLILEDRPHYELQPTKRSQC